MIFRVRLPFNDEEHDEENDDEHDEENDDEHDEEH
jgi:hypothetical protein